MEDMGCVATRKESEISKLLQNLNSENKQLMELCSRLAQVLEPIRLQVPKAEGKNPKPQAVLSPLGQQIFSRTNEISLCCGLLN